MEVDGDIHNEAQQKEYDIGRTKELEKIGITVIRFSNKEIFDDVENVLKRLQGFIDKASEKAISK